MSHYQLEDDSNMHPLEYLFVTILIVGFGNCLIYLPHPPPMMQSNAFDIWEMIHKVGYLVPFIGLFINQRKTIFGWFKKKKK